MDAERHRPGEDAAVFLGLFILFGDDVFQAIRVGCGKVRVFAGAMRFCCGAGALMGVAAVGERNRRAGENGVVVCVCVF